MDASRQAIIRELEAKFRPFTDALGKELRAWEFSFPEQRSAHLLHLDQQLVVRHALPYCLTEEALFDLDDGDVKFFAAVILLHSLALTRIDDYYDGGNQSADPLTVDSIAYSLSATHEAAISLIRQAPNAKELANMLSITNFVHARMYKDHTERYRSEFLDRPNQRLKAYLHSPKSRLLGSGYWEVMARASFAQRGERFPGYLHGIDIKLRKFRQIIDELADVEEDLRGGLVTLPVLHLLANHPQAQQIRHSIADNWQNPSAAIAISQLIQETNTVDWIRLQAMQLYESAISELDDNLGQRAEGYRRLFEFKRAKLDLLTM
jgi:hypothetical protein